MGKVGHHSCHFSLRLWPLWYILFFFSSKSMHAYGRVQLGSRIAFTSLVTDVI